MAKTSDEDYYDEMVDAFFDVTDNRTWKNVNHLKLVPKPREEKKEQSSERERAGTEYATEHQSKIEREMSRKFSKMNFSATVNSLTNVTITTLASTSAATSVMDSSLAVSHREDLPIFGLRETIIQNIVNNPVTIIQGLTGCGKSTQVPQYILDNCRANKENCKILVSQPRKISAITLAERVSEERRSVLGSEVGYQVALNKRADLEEEERTKILYCTTGIILQKLVHQRGSVFTHIIIDEVHERDCDIDFLLIVVRKMLASSSQVKIVLMSATLDAEQFSEFFKVPLEDGNIYKPPIIDLTTSKRSYEIKETYLEDFSSLQTHTRSELINYDEPNISESMFEVAMKIVFIYLNDQVLMMSTEGKALAILIFLPGLHEINQLHTKLCSDAVKQQFREKNMDPIILVLHSMVSMEDQKKAFKEGDKPKIILSTNIAESGVTLPLVTHVIDFCLTKYQSIVPGTQISSLNIDWASKNNCKQRAGRTGRVCQGLVARLVNKSFFESGMKEYPTPEMMRIGLESVVIKSKMLNIGKPVEVLALAIDPPNKSSIVDAILLLKELGALARFNEDATFDYEDGDLTFVGRLMAALPVDVRIAKFLVVAYLYSVLDDAIIIAAGLSLRSIFSQTYGKRRSIASYIDKLGWAKGNGSDLISTLNAFKEYLNISEESERFISHWCNRHSLDRKNLQEMELLVADLTNRLDKMRIKSLPNAPKYSPRDRLLVLKVAIAGAFGPAHFFKPIELTQSAERSAFVAINNLDMFRTIYFRNVNIKYGEIYEQQLIELMRSRGITGNDNPKMSIFFDQPTNEKIVVTFEKEMDSREDGLVPGRAIAEVYRAVKSRKLFGHLRLQVLHPEEAYDYALKHNLACIDKYGALNEKNNKVKFPGLICLPTIAVEKMHGVVTAVENCNKFFFRPIKAFGQEPEDIEGTKCFPDVRYKQYTEEIQSFMKEVERVAVGDTKLKLGQFVIVLLNKQLERGTFVGKPNAELLKVHFIDRGNQAEVAKETVFTLAKIEDEEALLEPPKRVFECTLTNVQPSGIKSNQGKWTMQAIETFREGVVDRKASIKIYSVVGEIASVQLSVRKKNQQDIDWNLKMIEDGFAEECEESYVSKIGHESRIYRRMDLKVEPETEFATMIDKTKPTLVIPSPPPATCELEIKLIGPYSVLETDLAGMSRLYCSKVAVDPSSVNSVILNDDILNFNGKFCVAADMTMSAHDKAMTVRESTMMPNIAGLDVLLALIFAPTAELRRDEKKTRYASVITGLGFDQERQQPYFGERDALFMVDFSLTEDDIKLINRLRHKMSLMIKTSKLMDFPNITDGVKEATLDEIQTLLIEIIHKKRSALEVIHLNDAFDWNVDRTDLQHRTNPLGHQATFDFIDYPKLFEVPKEMKEELLLHAEELKLIVRGQMTTHRKICRLCNFEWEGTSQLSLHLLSQKHINRKKSLEN